MPCRDSSDGEPERGAFRGMKPFDDVGAGTREIRIKDASGIYRVMCVAKFEDVIYVLHCFQKRTQTTGKQDKAIAKACYPAP
ncbi:MAG: type II toxin-antitoxin system RelE/ParE family toxin [Nitrospirae bacterium]|nr:type II toxin-antitoxin system RelE/ParE family toxin [Nitrospirota bacterium]MCL5285341.1 type II toxin-antitoxin system RelE/ParE family toxin [Nitrospirota bacterium]